MRFEKFFQPNNLKAALKILKTDKNSIILGGTTFLRLSDKKYSAGIDLSNLNLDYIKKTDNQIEIGAYTSLREIEINPIIQKYFGNIIPKSVENIVGIQFRNNATVGGTVFSRHGYSELITALSVLDCNLEFAEAGKISFNDFITNWNIKRDILKKIIIPIKKGKYSYKMMRKSNADFPILTVAVSRVDKITIAIGARPAITKIAVKASTFISSNNFTDENIAKTVEIMLNETKFGNDIRSSKEYKISISKVLVKRALLEVKQ